MTDKPKVYKVNLSDLIPDAQNANLGTERGRAALEQSLQQFGAGRSILLDRAGRIIAGNKTGEVAGEVGLQNVIIVETDGHELVAVKRMDLDLEEGDRARLMAYQDNRSGQVDLEWDIDQLVGDMESGLDLTGIWFEDELAEMIDSQSKTALSDVDNKRDLGDARKQIKAVMYADQVATFERALLATGVKNRAEALMQICQEYLGAAGQFDLEIESLVETALAE